MTRDRETEIIKQVQSGDAEAFGVLVDEYQRNVYNLALRMVSNPEDAADMAQEAFIKAFNSLSGFRGDSKFSVWLYRIVSNVCLDFLRSKKRRITVPLSIENDDGEIEDLDVADETFSPEKLLERKLTRDSVRRGLMSIAPDYRQILLLREIQGMTYEEISKVLSLEEGTVKSRIFRARKKLCEFLISDGNIPDTAASSNNRGGDCHE